MDLLPNFTEFAALILAFLTAPLTLAGIALSVPTYLLSLRYDKRRQPGPRASREQILVDDRERKRRAALNHTLPPPRKRHGRGR